MRRIAVVMVCLAAFGLEAGAARLELGDVRPDGMKLSIRPYGVALNIEAPAVRHYSAYGELKEGQPGWRGPLLLPRTAWTFRALRPGSLVVTQADDPAVALIEGKDYALDPDWGAVAAVEGSDYPSGTQVHFEYEYTLSRLDLVERRPDGSIALVKGQPDMGQPHLPEPTPGSTPLLSVYLPPNTRALTMENVNLIDPDARAVPPVSGTQHIRRVSQKLASGEPVTIVFFGDSITAQRPRDFRDGRGSFVDRFTQYLRDRFPGRDVVVTPCEEKVASEAGRIVILKAGVGGDDTPRALRRIRADVLDHDPDAVVVMFGVNDENGRGGVNNVPPLEYRKNMEEIVDRCRAAGAEIILMTTSMKNRDWVGTVGNLDEYSAVVREVAREKATCLVDNYHAWVDLPKVGYNYMIYLGTCINHPVDLGHELFFQGLKAAFESGGS